MSDSISVRITLDSYDLMHPREKQTQVYVQIPEVARVSYMLPAERFQGLKDRAWPEVLDVADEHYERGWAVEDSTTVAARAAVRAWLRDDANRDEMQAAFEADHARRDPVARKLLEENERLRARVAELEQLAVAARALHVQYPDSEHCQHDGESWPCPTVEALNAHNTAPGPDGEADRIVAYRNSDRPGVLLCREHGDGWVGLTPLTSEDLPDGGLCTWGWPKSEQCGRDVLITEAGDPR
ncbi:hypothetical protein [Streptomyces scopuliridis]|uniref:Uncharacterized protein n=1 Tax=Streptomyces scopuliridis RB72 TaxID=1440053 RepID=A0A2T7SP55_9ACTN|nr:hypothetical protein [Streptomyces scopuliridis]PVE04639.1 hypothetical protein Y717_10615 [Streptomyces scopuliridis RB72]